MFKRSFNSTPDENDGECCRAFRRIIEAWQCDYVLKNNSFTQLEYYSTIDNEYYNSGMVKEMNLKKFSVSFNGKKDTSIGHNTSTLIRFPETCINIRPDLDIPKIKVGTRLAIRSNLLNFLESCENKDQVEL